MIKKAQTKPESLTFEITDRNYAIITGKKGQLSTRFIKGEIIKGQSSVIAIWTPGDTKPNYFTKEEFSYLIMCLDSILTAWPDSNKVG